MDPGDHDFAEVIPQHRWLLRRASTALDRQLE
jgi:hypothetical protein